MAFDVTLDANAAFNNAGKFGKSLSGGLGLVSGGILTGLTDLTLEGWVKSTSNTLQCAVGVSGVIWMGIDGTGKATARIANANTYVEDVITSAAAITDGAGHHLALVIAAGTNASKFYVDGVLAGSFTQGMHPSAGRGLDMGFRTLPGNGFSWQGEIDDFALHSFAKYTAPFTPPTAALPNSGTNLVAVYHFDGDGLNKAGADPTAPVFTAPPTINGTPRVGEAASYTSGAITTNEAPTVTQQWTLDGVDVAGATGATYTPAAGDAGKALRVRQKAVNSASPGGVTSTSAPVTVLAAATSATRTVNVTLYANKGVKAADKAGLKVSFSTGTGPQSIGTVLYQSATETTDASGVLSFTFDSNALAVGQQGLLMVLGAAGEHYIGLAAVA